MKPTPSPVAKWVLKLTNMTAISPLLSTSYTKHYGYDMPVLSVSLRNYNTQIFSQMSLSYKIESNS